MNRLQIVQRAKQEAGLLGPVAATTSTIGIDTKIVSWVDDAWNRIQQSRNWNWMWENPTLTIVATTNTTATLDGIAHNRYERARTLDTKGSPIYYLPWSRFTQIFPTALMSAGTPNSWSVNPTNAFVVNTKPTTNFSLTVERYKNPSVMTADADIPALPTEHHMLIVWRAVMLYAGQDEATSLYQHASAEYKKTLTAIGMTDKPAAFFEYTW